MKTLNDSVLTINAGSSSIKFALFGISGAVTQLLSGHMEGMGKVNTTLSYKVSGDNAVTNICIDTSDINDAGNIFFEWLKLQESFSSIKAIGHRIVFGMKHTQPEVVTDQLLYDLKSMSAYDPEHLPGEIKLMELFKRRCAGIPQIACFDTAFHTSMPAVAKLLPIPRKFITQGVQRYGFHGISYSYLLEELEKLAGGEAAQGKVVLAHLGSGASLCAVKAGKSLDTTMGFTPASGLPMGTRTGDLDPGVAWFLIKRERMDAPEFNHLINHESGMLGISETSADMRDLLTAQDLDSRAAEAIEFFCYQTKKYISSFAAVLGGLETLVFSGGIGEHAPEIRKRICSGLEFLGIEIDNDRNENTDAIISKQTGRVCVRVINTNEQLMIARAIIQSGVCE